MKTGIMVALRRGVVLASVFTPFLVVLNVLLTHRVGVYLEASISDDLSWIWLMLVGAMMLGIYFLTAYVAFYAFEHETEPQGSATLMHPIEKP